MKGSDNTMYSGYLSTSFRGDWGELRNCDGLFYNLIIGYEDNKFVLGKD